MSECECGRPKADKKTGACGHCRFLDGARSGAQDVIAILRTVGSRLTVIELADLTGLHYTNVTSIIKRLVRDGRAVKTSESVLVESAASVSGVSRTQRTYYELVSRSPRVARAAKRARSRRGAAVEVNHA